MTTKQRIMAYEYAIREIEKTPRWAFMCQHLHFYLFKYHNTDVDFKYENVNDALPEFGLFEVEKNKLFIWSADSHDANSLRKTILLLCIEMAKRP